MHRGTRPGAAECQRRTAHGLGRESAGVVPDRAGTEGVPRSGSRPPARDGRSARHRRRLQQVGGASRTSGSGAGADRRSIPADASGPAGSGRARNALGCVHTARRGGPGRALYRVARAPARHRCRGRGRAPDRGQPLPDDFRGRWCTGGSGFNSRAGRAAGCAGRRISQRARRGQRRA